MITMVSIKLLLCLVVVVQYRWSAVQSKSVEGPPIEGVRPDILAFNQESDEKSSSGLVGALSRKVRNAGCLRCYEDRYGGGYGRSGDDRNNWYYPSYDRYNDRFRPDYDRNSYRDRDDRYMPRTYDRYDNRGYENRGYDIRGYDSRSYDRYDTRRDYGESRGYGYDKGQYYDRYGGDRNDRYRPSSSKYGGGRDDYDRYYPRYDYRNYLPWDETYRGQSGFDNSGRGYYFAGDSGSDRRYLPTSSPCGVRVPNCRYGGNGDDGANAPGTRVSSGPISSQNDPNGHTNYNSYNNSNNNNNNGYNNSSNTNRPNGWSYINDSNNRNTHDSDSSGSPRGRENDQQSSPYGGRPVRPIKGSYLFDRDSNSVTAGDSGSANANDGRAQKNDKKDGSSSLDRNTNSGSNSNSART